MVMLMVHGNMGTAKPEKRLAVKRQRRWHLARFESIAVGARVG